MGVFVVGGLRGVAGASPRSGADKRESSSGVKGYGCRRRVARGDVDGAGERLVGWMRDGDQLCAGVCCVSLSVRVCFGFGCW